MIKLSCPLPRDVILACSGGVDSMAALDFLSRKHNVTAAFFDHGTLTSKHALEILNEILPVKYPSVNLIVGKINRERSKDESQEEYWRNQRYEFFHRLGSPVITCHHLDDCVETWIWSSLHGEGKIIPFFNRNVIRPFRLTTKEDFKNWAAKNDLEWHEDYSNDDDSYMRNYIRKHVIPHAKVVNPGINKVIAKKIKLEQTFVDIQ